MRTRTATDSGSRRGQSEAIGVILLLGITIASVTFIVAFGSVAVSDSQDAVTVGSAEHAMTQLDSKASLVAHGDSNSQSVSLPDRGDSKREVTSDAGWMNVTIRNVTTGEVEDVLLNVSLGAVIYEKGDTTIAYQGGGVWRSTGNGSSMLSPPELHYRGETLTLPLVVINGDESLGSKTRITKAGSARPIYPNETSGRSNPLTAGKVVVVVHSDYYEAWGRFFAERTGGQSAVDHANETASITLVTPAQTNPVQTAISSTAAGDELKLSGSGNFPAFVDSYNSSTGNYSASKSNNGTVSTAGDVEMSGNSLVEGNVESGGAVTLKGGSNVSRRVGWTTGFTVSGSATYGSEERIDGVEGADPVDAFVRDKVETIKDDNDNGGTTAVDNDRLNFSGGDSVTLPQGTYYLEKIDMDDKNLTIETNGGQVEIAIGNGVQLDSDSNITVEGGGVVRVYVLDDADFKSGSSVHVPGHRSPGFWLYGTDDMETTIEGSQGSPVTFVGVVYAPSAGGDADVSVKHADVYGALVGGQMTISTGGAVHYDQALKSANTLPVGAQIPKVTYLHVSVTEVNVTDAGS